ncbi:hypothetical protein GDO81_024659 [Engystomops pustulosus]|uniref:Uncharacterized protein n=1 Tax=Engystomops pustulosus TaxID=76066 RepID=A0AAV6ZRL6_ENGPU|nr:hypothetical protein GDO81_024659 [Engystomops pustulosus]
MARSVNLPNWLYNIGAHLLRVRTPNFRQGFPNISVLRRIAPGFWCTRSDFAHDRNRGPWPSDNMTDSDKPRNFKKGFVSQDEALTCTGKKQVNSGGPRRSSDTCRNSDARC